MNDVVMHRCLPGHRKQTNDTKINWNSGEAYQGNVIGPNFTLLYFHPVGISTTSVCWTEDGWVGDCVTVVLGPFLPYTASAISQVLVSSTEGAFGAQ